MNDINQSIHQLDQKINQLRRQLGFDHRSTEIKDLEKLIIQPNFWHDQAKAQSVTKKLAKLKAELKPWQQLASNLKDLMELAALNDETMHGELEIQYNQIENRFNDLKKQLLYKGLYDNYDVIMSIYAGAGGTDAQDWTEMLMRMYIRWAEAHDGTKVDIIDQSLGDEAGIKSVTMAINGPLAYGQLQAENGVHRLVRLSPFNADHLRQTSFARVEVIPKIDQPDDIIIDDKDIKIDVFRSGGHGGQSVNTTDSAVRLTHLPTGISIVIQNERSQLQNKEMAMTILRSRLVKLQLDQHQAKLDKLKGPNEQAAWGNQIRSYVMHPYSMVKDLRSRHETSDIQAVLAGKIDDFIRAYLEWSIAQS